MIGALACCCLFVPAMCAQAPPRVCDPLKFGAKADGRTKDTAAIQAAIDDCAGHGGGTVRLSAGTYLSAPLELKSKIVFEVMKDAVLQGSAEKSDYVTPADGKRQLPLLHAANVSDVAITGDGVIDGADNASRAESRALL